MSQQPNTRASGAPKTDSCLSALEAYRAAVAAANTSLPAPDRDDDEAAQRAADRIAEATAVLADEPALTPRAIADKLEVLKEVLVDEQGGAEHVDERLLNLLEAIRRDVNALAASNSAAASSATAIRNLDAFDALTLRVRFLAALTETMRQAIEFSDLELDRDRMHDSLAALAHLARETEDALFDACHGKAEVSAS